MNSNNNVSSTWELVKHYMKPIAAYLDTPGVTEIMIDRFDKIYIEKNGSFEEIPETFKNNAEVEKLIEQIGNALNQPVERDKFPILDARLPSKDGRPGARINAVMPPIATKGACLTIRVFPSKIMGSADLLAKGSFSEDMLKFFKLAVAARCNIIVSGGTGSGKTTLINILSSFIPNSDRIITIEDTAELQLDAPFLVSMEAPRRKSNAAHDSQDIDMAFLLRNALRQRPDRIIVGEIRSNIAATSFLQAINTGHDGCMTTLHANSAIDALVRLESLAASENQGLPYEVTKQQVRGNIQLLIHQQRIPGHGRCIVEVAELNETHEPQLLYQWDYKLKKHIMCEILNESVIMKKIRLTQ